jgi:hypothetical protein
MQVLAVIGDLVGSKSVTRRAAFQRKLEKLLARTSEGAHGLASPYTITLGDEFQAVYRSADSLFADVGAILAEIHPVQVRLAIGVGELTTRINTQQALGMDGPAFHRARETLNALKDDGRLLRIGAAEAGDWALANRVLNLLSHQIEGWSRNRLLVLAGLLRDQPVSEIERGLKISRVAVYKNIRAAALDDVVGICHELTTALNRALRDA